MAQVLTSISGIQISAASAGYSPTNSGDVSAIASAYQVVSSTATQLYAGTAYLTSVNGAPVSASRAGNAANASLANSAYYDGTGRLISALPDSAAVSSIASSYAESAASSKADSSSLSSYALSADVSGVIDTVSANSASWSGGTLPITGTSGDDSANYDAYHVEFTRYDTAGEPDIRTAEMSPDHFYIDYTLDENDHTIMTLTESMLDFTDSEGDHVVDAYSIDSWNSAVDTVANNSATWGQGGVDSATVSAIASAYQVVSSTGSAKYWNEYIHDFEYVITDINGSAIASYHADVAGIAKEDVNGRYISGFVESADVSAIASAYQVVSSTASGSGEIFGQTSYYATEINGLTLSAQEAALASYATNAGSAAAAPTNSSEVSAIASSYVESAVSSKQDSSAMSAYALSSNVSGVIDTVSANSATWGQGGVVTSTGSSTYWSAGNEYTVVNRINGSSLGAATSYSANSAYQAVYDQSGRRLDYLPDTAKVSAIASSYAESAASSKLDSSASSSFYTTANESGFVDSAYVDSAVSGKMDTSAMTSYALSADVSGTVDLVSTQSANWGGSALALSAGNGISLEKTGNTLVMSTDETLLWSGFEKASGTVHSLSEPMSNFERLKFVVSVHSAAFQRASQVTEYDITNNTSTVTFFYPECRTIAANTLTSNILYVSSDSTSNWTLVGGLRYVNTALTTGVGTYDFYVNKIIGVNRTAGV